jgi:hypothetical protein
LHLRQICVWIRNCAPLLNTPNETVHPGEVCGLTYIFKQICTVRIRWIRRTKLYAVPKTWHTTARITKYAKQNWIFFIGQIRKMALNSNISTNSEPKSNKYYRKSSGFFHLNQF